MSRRYNRRRSEDNPLAALGMLMLLLLVGVYFQLSALKRLMALVVLLILLALVIMLIVRRREYELMRLQALKMTDVDQMPGLEFEKYVAKILQRQGYSNVSLTEYYDWGVDIIAQKGGVRWGVQVKRYGGLVRAEAVRQVVTGLKKYKCTRAMVVTNSTYSRQARELAKSNNCVLVDKDILADWIIAFRANEQDV